MHRSIHHFRGNGNSTASGGASALMIASSVSTFDRRTNAQWPLTISYRIRPNEKMSERVSTRSPLACSGLMYSTVPITAPSADMETVTDSCEPFPESGVRDFASPKSTIFARPSRVSRMFSGFRSRCTIDA
jgi:hypothetical protein